MASTPPHTSLTPQPPRTRMPLPPYPVPPTPKVLLVENALYLPDAIKRLRASMQDPVLAIDLEWRPQFGPHFTPVAMLQLASSRMALLVRTCRMQYRLAPELLSLLQVCGLVVRCVALWFTVLEWLFAV